MHGKNRREEFLEQALESDGDGSLVSLRFPGGFEPHRSAGRFDPDEAKRGARVELLKMAGEMERPSLSLNPSEEIVDPTWASKWVSVASCGMDIELFEYLAEHRLIGGSEGWMGD
jgi:hypothetical protein